MCDRTLEWHEFDSVSKILKIAVHVHTKLKRI